MTVAPARRAAYEVVLRVFEDDAYADRALRSAVHGLDERDRALEPRTAHELDGLVHRSVCRDVGEAELVRAEPERRTDRRVELAHRTLPERLDRVVERAHPLH